MSESKRNSIECLYRFLKPEIESEEGTPKWIYEACATQESLARLTRQDENIIGMSVNTFKKYCDEYLPGGFAEIDSIRKTLSREGNQRNKKPVKVARNPDVSYKRKLDKADRERAMLIRAYWDLNKILLDALPHAPLGEIEYRKHQEIYGKYMSLTMVS